MIRARALALERGGRRVLDGIDFELRAGEFVAVLGPNGVGKTTLLRACAGFEIPAAGAIELDGEAIHRLPVARRARQIAMLASDELLADELRVRDVVAIGRFPHRPWWKFSPGEEDERAIAEAIAATHIEEYLDRVFTHLSSGEQQRVWIAMALAQGVPLLLLDEPTTHLDVRVAHNVLELLRERTTTGTSVLCVLHDINEAAAVADRILLLGCGRMLALAPPAEVLASSLLDEAYGIAMHRARTDDGRTIVVPAHEIGPCHLE
ncbi:MAG TPA: ABC transporter ATP-binding protein [Candidatus Dormibacteraeota bacterium]|nr:ABC transporter ATP-binding protein [Candidatus Dormibacteraeota bacterium]